MLLVGLVSENLLWNRQTHNGRDISLEETMTSLQLTRSTGRDPNWDAQVVELFGPCCGDIRSLWLKILALLILVMFNSWNSMSTGFHPHLRWHFCSSNHHVHGYVCCLNSNHHFCGEGSPICNGACCLAAAGASLPPRRGISSKAWMTRRRNGASGWGGPMDSGQEKDWSSRV